MTTAARPTFEPARGGRGKGEGGGDLSALSKQYSSRDLPGHTKIKYRSVSSLLAVESRTDLDPVWYLTYGNCSYCIYYVLTLKVDICWNLCIYFSLQMFSPSSGNPPRMPLRRCVPVTSAGSWRRGSAWWHVKRPEREDQEVGLSADIRHAVH